MLDRIKFISALDAHLALKGLYVNNHNFIQVKGTVMGTIAAPNDANVCMGQLEDRFVYRTPSIGDKISWDTLLTEDTIKDTFIVFQEK